MAHVKTYRKVNAASERPTLNYTYAVGELKATTEQDVVGRINEIKFEHSIYYGGTSSLTCQVYFIIIASDGTEYKSDTTTLALPDQKTTDITLIMPEASCPPASVLNSGNFRVKRVGTAKMSDGHDQADEVLIQQNTTQTLTVTYSGCAPYVYNGSKWVEAVSYSHNGEKWVESGANYHNGAKFG